MGKVIVPLTALPILFWRVSVTVVIGFCCFAFVSIIDADDSAGEGSDLSEGYKDSLMDLSLWGEECDEEEQTYSG